MRVCARPTRDGTRLDSTSVQRCTWHLYNTPTGSSKLASVSDAAAVFWYAYHQAAKYSILVHFTHQDLKEKNPKWANEMAQT